MQKKEGFEWLIHPITKEQFAEEYFEKKVLHIKQDAIRTPKYYSNLLTRESLDLFLNEQNVKYPEVQLVGTPKGFKHREYLKEDNSINLSKLFKYYSEGATINVVGLNNYLLPLGNLCENLIKETSHRYQTNIYCTPKNTQGFEVHYDSHDVIVLQVHGTKNWEIYDSPIELPLKGLQNFTPEQDLNPTLKQKLTLKEGELLYIPRGVMHNAKSADTSSIHITLGLVGTSIYKLLTNSLAEIAKGNKKYRQFLPLGYINDKDAKEKIKEEFKNLIKDFENQIDLDSVLNTLEDNVIKNTPVKLINQLENIDNILEENIDYNQVSFSVRKSLIIKTEIVKEELVIKANGLEHNFPDYVLNTFNKICETDTFTTSDLGNDLDSEGKEVLLEYLIKEGIIIVV